MTKGGGGAHERKGIRTGRGEVPIALSCCASSLVLFLFGFLCLLPTIVMPRLRLLTTLHPHTRRHHQQHSHHERQHRHHQHRHRHYTTRSPLAAYTPSCLAVLTTLIAVVLMVAVMPLSLSLSLVVIVRLAVVFVLVVGGAKEHERLDHMK